MNSFARTAGVLIMLFSCTTDNARALQESPIEREVTFSNGSVQLKGTFMSPIGEGPHPAVVFLHGSGPSTRQGARPYAEEFARLGIASLFYDKRGSGESGGSWITSSLEDLAFDALAAVEFLKSESHVDSRRIGFWGVSQAGWVAPFAAARSDDIAFMILVSGGGASPYQSELHSYEYEFDRAGWSTPQKEQAREVLDEYYAYLETGTGRDALSDRLEALHSGPLQPLAERLQQILPSEKNHPNWQWVATYDPAQHIAEVDFPVLLMFGSEDTDHPTDLAVRRWRAGLKKAQNDEASILVFPGAGHGLRLRDGTSGGGRAPFVDGYAEIMLGWLWMHVVQRR